MSIPFQKFFDEEGVLWALAMSRFAEGWTLYIVFEVMERSDDTRIFGGFSAVLA